MTEFSSNLAKIASRSYQRITPILKHPSLLTSLVIAGLVITVRQFGGLQPLELMAYDQMIRLRPDQGTDSRLLIVAITEDDIRSQNQWPISDEVVAQLLKKLQSYHPRVIGLDLYRDVPQQPGRTHLAQQLKAPNIIAIKLLADAQGNEVPPPPGFPKEQVGFSDIVLDPDAVVRRNLLFAKTDTNTDVYSFGLRLSLAYLGLSQQSIQVFPDSLQIGQAVFPSLSSDAGNYRNLDDRGYQLLLNYRTGKEIANTVTLTQVLHGAVNPSWIKDKLVLVGTTAPSVKDLFVTPYNLSDADAPKTPGVQVHAQMVSQILDATTGTRPLIAYWPEPVELLWVWAWALVGSISGWRLRHPLALGATASLSVGGLFLICFGLLLNAGWIPWIPAAIAVVGSGAGAVAYRLLYDTFHDSLTGLPNRALFMRQIGRAIHLHKNTARLDQPIEFPTIAVLLLGLDSFKAINDSFGHRMGDQLLVATTYRLKSFLHPTDKLARVGGDEFAILRQKVEDTDEVTYLADQLQRQMTQPYKLNGQEVFTTASVGIVLGKAGANYEPEDILRDVHTAMNRAKASGKARHEVFVTGMRDQVMTRLQLETDLRRAIERQEFRLHYQPIVSLQTGKLAGFEALVRWHHPQRGLVPPVEFIPIAEETELIIPMSQWIIREACDQLKRWQNRYSYNPPLLVSVNFSGKQFSQTDLVEQIEQTLQETGLDGCSLKLEITESTAMTDVEATIALLQRLKSLNLQLSIDDFGTGYSSLSYLHRFPTNTIKVDRSFVSRMGEASEDAQIVQTIIILGHNLGMDIVAEGVETAEQLAQLRLLGCEYGQGYFFSKPLPAESAETLLKNEPQW